jgi:hypothetical protein
VPKHVLILAAALLLVSTAPAAGEEKPADASGPPQALSIRVASAADWKCEVPDVEKVLESAAGELWPHFPGRQLAPIEVAPKGGPIVLFQRGPKGEYRVRLNTGDRLWSQIAYQFAHEFCHILCNYDEKHAPTKWFEESLCETASLFALRRMAETWQTRPPYPNWKSYAPHLASYATERLKNAALPKDKAFPQWYRENAEAFRASAADRPRNTLVAAVLLPLFERQPQAWGAVTYLNKEIFPGPYTFEDHLTAWRRNCPPERRAFVSSVAAAFGIDLGTGDSEKGS